MARARAAIAEQLAFTKAHMTWSKEANELEDRIADIWRSISDHPEKARAAETRTRLHEIGRVLHTMELPFDEWGTLFRNQLLVERGVLQVMAGLTDRPRDVADSPGGQTDEVAGRGGLLKKGAIAAAGVAGLVGLAWLSTQDDEHKAA